VGNYAPILFAPERFKCGYQKYFCINGACNGGHSLLRRRKMRRLFRQRRREAGVALSCVK
jgi:hypothetical protein